MAEKYGLDKAQSLAAWLALKTKINSPVQIFVSDRSQAFRIIFRI